MMRCDFHPNLPMTSTPTQAAVGVPQHAEPEWLDDGTPYSREFGDVYYSSGHGMAEARHVFLAGNALEPRWRSLANRPDTVFVIHETGFGTGLNFLLAWQLWERVAPPAARLVFRSLEAYPLRRDALARAHAAWPELAPYAAALIAAWPPLLPGLHVLDLDGGRVRLQLYIGDVLEALDECGASTRPELAPPIDAWFLDGFAPARNPAMWEPRVLQRIGALSRPGTTLATFTAAGAVRSTLAAAGFAVERSSGFGRKRHMLTASFTQAPHTPGTPACTPWHLCAEPALHPGHAVVIGAGIAGACCAHELAHRGVRVQVIEAGPAPASDPAAMPQGILFTQLPATDTAHGQFTLHSYLHATRFHAALFAGTDGNDYAQCGLLQLVDEDEEAGAGALAARHAAHPDLARLVDATEASAMAGIALDRAAIHLPASGWLTPQAARTRLLAHPLIESRFDCRAQRLRQAAGGWEILLDSGERIEAPVVIVATAAAVNELLGDGLLPVSPLRGQVTLLPRSLAGATPQCVLCAEGYVAPARNDWLCCGASYVRGGGDHVPTLEEHGGNLQRAHRLLRGLDPATIPPDAVIGRVGYRSSTPDRLPIAGAVPDAAALHRDFGALRHNARRIIDRTGTCLPGLYVSTGHGSRGLTSAPLCADAIAAAICGEPSPLPQRLQRAISPARFLIRDIIKGRNA